MKAITGLLAGLLVMVLGAAALAGGPGGEPTATRAALEEIPADLLPVYAEAAGSCPGLPWPVLAAIGWVESRHGQRRADPHTGDVAPPIVGPALDGTNGTQRIRDDTEADGWAHAHGPMQFLRSTWDRWGRLAPNRPAGAAASPHNAWDAIHTAAAYLCGTDVRISDLEQALLRYDRSDAYVREVLAKAAEYGRGAGSAQVDGLHCPVSGPVHFTDTWGAPRSGGRRHQGTDLVAPYGTPLVAIESGVIDGGTDFEQGLGGITLWLRGTSGTRYYYAHNARNIVRTGDTVVAGQVIANLGDTGNARTGGAHLHFQVHPGGDEPVNPWSSLYRLC